MAPEPYPQVKWTREQQEAYAEGRKSASQASQPGSPRSGRGRRVVRTAAGAKRYKVPIGAEIGSARNAQAGEAQKDTESTDRYRSLVGTDAAAQAKAMAGLSHDQLQRLTRVAYSWKSSNPDVVRLRIGLANELKRRGFNVNDFGGLGRGSARPTGPAPAKGKKPIVGAKKAVPPPPRRPVVRSAMQARKNDRKLRELSVPQLRKALGAVSKLPPDKRPVAARFLVRKAIELGVPHFLGRSVIELAGHTQAEVIELAGRWKHGWIPLDGTAMRSKMKGGNGKPWWSGGKQKRPNSAERMRRSVEAGRAARAGRTIPRNKPSSNKDVSKVRGVEPVTQKRYDPKDTPDFVKNSKGREFLNRRAAANKDKPLGYTTYKADGSETFTRMSKPKPFVAVPKKTSDSSVVPGERGRKGVPTTKQTGYRYSAVRTGSAEGSRQLRESRATAPDRLKRGREILDQELGKQVADIRAKRASKARTDVVKSSPKPERGSKMENATTKPSSEPFPAAASYLEKHGADKTREKLAALKKKRDGLKEMRRKTTSVDLEIRGLENVLARGTSGKA